MQIWIFCVIKMIWVAFWSFLHRVISFVSKLWRRKREKKVVGVKLNKTRKISFLSHLRASQFDLFLMMTENTSDHDSVVRKTIFTLSSDADTLKKNQKKNLSYGKYKLFDSWLDPRKVTNLSDSFLNCKRNVYICSRPP